MYNRQATHTATRTLIQEALASHAGEQYDARMGGFEAALATFLTMALPQPVYANIVTLVQRAAVALRQGIDGEAYFQLSAASAPYLMGWLPRNEDESTPLAPLFAEFFKIASPALLADLNERDYDDQEHHDRMATDEYAGAAGIDPATGQRWDDTLYEGPFAD